MSSDFELEFKEHEDIAGDSEQQNLSKEFHKVPEYLRELRYHQKQALARVKKELRARHKCLVKMFCGSGKSLLMYAINSEYKNGLRVYVFPSLALTEQFYSNYFAGRGDDVNALKISSESDGTTDVNEILEFLKPIGKPKDIIVTYRSLHLLLSNLGENKIDIICYDEAHHATSETYNKLIFVDNPSIGKQVFLTATPRNENKIVMYDRLNPDKSHCGKMVYNYTYLDGLRDGILQPFNIRVNMSKDNSNMSILECIARTIYASGNTRVLTFHSSVHTDNDTAVKKFVDDEQGLKKALRDVWDTEFRHSHPEPFTKVTMKALHSKLFPQERTAILNDFDQCDDNSVFMISSCATIGEGVDTKNANMCVFVDPKKSVTGIIQNFGRIVRKQTTNLPATILIPCWVDENDYQDCEDPEKRDKCIRDGLGKRGNFDSVLNVLSALRQEDEELYDLCMMYPSKFTKNEIDDNLKKQKFKRLEDITTLEDCLRHFKIPFDEYKTEEDMYDDIKDIADAGKVCIEIQTDNTECPVKIYNEGAEKTIRIYKDDDVCNPIVVSEKSGGIGGILKSPSTKSRPSISIHANSDLKVLWKVDGELDIDIARNIISRIIECEVNETWWEDRLDELDVFIGNNGRLPSMISKDPVEKPLGMWVSNQKTKVRKQTMTDERRIEWEKLKKKHPLAFKTDEEVWNDNLNDVDVFIDAKGRLPSTASKDPVEKPLGAWVRNQKTNVKNETMTGERIIEWEKLKKKHPLAFRTGEEVWNDTCIDVDVFIGVNGRLPAAKSKDPVEKPLGVWVVIQKKSVRKQTMTDERSIEWEKLKKKYPKHFPNQTPQSSPQRPTQKRNPSPTTSPKSQPSKKHRIDNETSASSYDIEEMLDESNDAPQPKSPFPKKRKPTSPPVSKAKSPKKARHGVETTKMVTTSAASNSLNVYHSSNVPVKDEINGVLQVASQDIPPTGLIIPLDHTDFRTAKAINQPWRTVIPQRDLEAFKEMKNDPTFGDRVWEGDLLEYSPVEKIALLYADLTGCIKEAEPILWKFKPHLMPGGVVAVTICARGDGESDFCNSFASDITELSHVIFPGRKTIMKVKVYGKPAMATIIFKVE